VSEDVIQKVWAMMLSFDGYSFCKPHSASYAMVSFQSAYLRVHHPAEFMAAVLSNQGGYYRPHAYIAEIRRMRLFTLGPDVNLSRWKYYGKGRDVVIGLMAIKGLSASGAKAVLEERERGGDFTSLENFSRRVSLNRDDIVALCPAGVFDSIAGGLSRHLQARRLLSAGSRETGSRGWGVGNGELFSLEPGHTFIAPPENKVGKTEDDIWEEYRALGFLRKSHPLALWKDEVMAVTYRVKASRIAEYVGQNVKMVGWSVAQKEVWTKDGLAMNFLSLEDETGLYETVIFPHVYEKYGKLLFDPQPLLVYGRVTNDDGAISVEVNRLNPLQQARSALLPRTSGGSLFYGNCPQLKAQENAPDQYPARISSGRR